MDSLKNTLKRWEIKGIIQKGELPDVDSDLIWDWKMSQDKEMVIQMVKSLEKRTFNYLRKIFGLNGSSPNSTYMILLIYQLI